MAFYSDNLLLYSLGLCVTVVLLVRARSKYNTASRIPPGPRSWLWSILGNIVDLAGVDPAASHLAFTKWADQYGDLVGLSAVGKTIVVINSPSAVRDLLHSRSAIYSDRPPMTVMEKWGGMFWTLFFQRYGPEMHTQRRMINQCLGVDALDVYYPIVSSQARTLGQNLLAQPEAYDGLIKRMAGETILTVVFGKHAPDVTDKMVDIADRFDDSLAAAIKTAAIHPVDLLPFLAKLPSWLWGREFSRNLNLLKAAAGEIFNIPYRMARDSITLDSGGPSMTRSLVERHLRSDGEVELEYSIKSVTGVAYAAGTATVATSLEVFLYAMIKYPEVQKKAQQFIDAQVAMDSLPTPADRTSIPYLNAILQETMRWLPMVPTGIPHSATQDDWYNGHLIPKGSIMIVNAWKCLHDDKLYPNPFEFNPDRFSDGITWNEETLDPRKIAFGFGRRICPGRHLAELILWTNIATLLAVFDIRRPLDAEGKEWLPELDWVVASNLLHIENMFPCRLIPRSNQRLEALNQDQEN
ncbi:cytochrome P450 [Mycena metata]|uniref:Cytochrome P450 n=1 Tax=Mycena metata TaxID=1033252 RepID=A0AAD7IWK2_9AGAR|nr:cytochrome P450 [Mycena metata]